MKSLKNNIAAFACAAFAGMQTAWGAAAVTFDLTGTAGSVLVDGSYFFPAKEAGIGGTTPAGATVSGTGTWDEFYNLGATGNEGPSAGYNTGLNQQNSMTGVGSSPNNLVRLNELGVAADNPNATGEALGYYTFGLDINEANNLPNSLLSLDDLQIWVRDTPLASGATSLTALQAGTANVNYKQVWGLDNTANREILLDYAVASSGSGRGDMIFAVPQSLFPAAMNGQANYYVYLYSAFGAKGTENVKWYDQAGNEQWNIVTGESIFPPALIPEASTLGAVFSLSSFGLFHVWRRRAR